MAKTPKADTKAAKKKEPGRLKQIWEVLKMTVKYDRAAIWLFIGAVLLPLLIAVAVALVFYTTEWLMWILLVVLGLLAGVLLFMFTLNWRAEKVSFEQIEGKIGAAGQVLSMTMRGQWQTSDTPIAFNPKTQDCVYRAVGKPGVILVSEGNVSSVKRLVADERRKVTRVAPNVPVHHVHVGVQADDVRLIKLRKTLNGFDKKLTKAEILAVTNRLSSIRSNAMPIPKGIDPYKVRPQRSKMR